jgi:hypothetical protein
MFNTAHIPAHGYCFNERCHNSAAACFLTPTGLAVTISESHVAKSKMAKMIFGLVLVQCLPGQEKLVPVKPESEIN